MGPGGRAIARGWAVSGPQQGHGGWGRDALTQVSEKLSSANKTASQNTGPKDGEAEGSTQRPLWGLELLETLWEPELLKLFWGREEPQMGEQGLL